MSVGVAVAVMTAVEVVVVDGVGNY